MSNLTPEVNGAVVEEEILLDTSETAAEQTEVETEAEAAEVFEQTEEEDEKAPVFTGGSEHKSERAKGKKGGSHSKTVRIVAVVALVLIVVGIFLPILLSVFSNKSPILTGGVVMTVNGEDVMADEYTYYMTYMLSTYINYFGEDYFQDEENMQLAIDTCEAYFKDHYTVVAWAKSEGYDLTDEQRQEVLETVKSVKLSYDSDEEFYEALKNACLTEDLYYRMLCNDTIVASFSEYLYDTENSPYRPTNSEIDGAIKDGFVLGAKHIYFSPSSVKEENDKVVEHANAILARIEAGEDFDTLMRTYSEDPGLESNPNGYTFIEGQMVDDFYATTLSLDFGEHSDVILSDAGYHIILRIEPDREETALLIIDQKLSADYDARVQSAVVEHAKGYDKIAFSDFIAAMQAA